MVLRAGLSAAWAAFEPAINGLRDVTLLCRLPGGARLAACILAKAAMLNRATPPEHRSGPYVTAFYLFCQHPNAFLTQAWSFPIEIRSRSFQTLLVLRDQRKWLG